MSSNELAAARDGRALVSRASGARLRGTLRLVSGAVLVSVACAAGAAGLDLRALQVVPQRGQSADQARRDRYECHNWAVEQTGVIPSAQPQQRARRDERARAERIGRVIRDTIVGAGLGGLVRAVQDKDPDRGVLAGAAIGAAVGVAKSRPEKASERPQIDPASRDYLRALSACLEGRGYAVALPGEGGGADKSGAAEHKQR